MLLSTLLAPVVSLQNPLLPLLSGMGAIELKPFEWPAAVCICIIVLLLICSAFMSASEVAYFSLSPQDIHNIRESNDKVDKRVLHLLENSERLLATILIGNNVVNIAIILLSNYTLEQIVDFSNSEVLRFILQTIGLTFLILLFGEIIPKVSVRPNPMSFSKKASGVLSVLFKTFGFASKGLVKMGRHFSKNDKKSYDLSVDDLSKAVELTEGKSPEQSEIMESIINLYAKTADEIMTPRVDMLDVNFDWDFRHVLDFIVEGGKSRYPVYKGTEDTIMGFLYIKDCIDHIDDKEDFDWHKIMRKAYFVPENKMLDDLLEEFRSEKIHMAIVVDEYGGTQGVITLEDILEEIVGEIADEYDVAEIPYTKLPSGELLFPAKTQITDFCRLLSLPTNVFEGIDQEVDTIGGIFLEMKQVIPRVGDSVEYNGIKLTVMQMDKYRIQELKVKIGAQHQSASH